MTSFEIRGLSDRLMPEHVTAKLTTMDNFRLDLNLRHVPHLDVALPLEFIRVDKEGQLVTRAEHIIPSNDVSYYQDNHYKAAIQLTRYWDRTHELFGYNMRGHVIFHDSIYYIDSETDNASQSEARYQFSTPLPNETQVQIVSLERRQINLVMEMPAQGLKCQEHVDANETRDGNDGKKGKPPRRLSGDRRRRQSDTYFIDIIGVVDYGLYKVMKDSFKGPFPQKIYEHFVFLFNEVDLLYKNLGSEFVFNIRLNKILISENKEASSYIESIANEENNVEALRAIDLLNNFLVNNSKNFLEGSDHVMVFTNYDLYAVVNERTNKAVSGVANTGAMCHKDGTSCSIIEHLTNGFIVAIIITHELGHSLSANHDGHKNNCTASDRYIMAPSNAQETPTTILNPFKFSPCSQNSFKEFINYIMATKDGTDCLTKSFPVSETIPNINNRLLGLEMSPDEQCEDLRGKGSFFCRHMIPAASKVCTNLWCSLPTNPYICRIYLPHSGTLCGQKKMCLFGKCEEDSRAPDAKGTCVFGDPPGIVLDDKTCAQVVNDSILQCYINQHVISNCCGTCGKLYRPFKGCEYGDKANDCTKDHCNDNAETCCETCNYGDLLTTVEESLTTKHDPGVDHVPGVDLEPGVHPMPAIDPVSDVNPVPGVKHVTGSNYFTGFVRIPYVGFEPEKTANSHVPPIEITGDLQANQMTVTRTAIPEVSNARPTKTTEPPAGVPYSRAHKMYNEVYSFLVVFAVLLCILSI